MSRSIADHIVTCIALVLLAWAGVAAALIGAGRLVTSFATGATS